MYRRRTSVFEYVLIAFGILLVLNKLGIDLLKPNKDNTYDDEKPKYPVNRANLSYNNAAFKRLAGKLVRAMDTDSLWDGTYEDDVYEVFGYMHNIDDMHELINVFGIKTYSGDEWGQWQLQEDPQYNLITWLDKELSSDEKTNVNKILKNKNIDFKI
jgi:hypothetical protein